MLIHQIQLPENLTSLPPVITPPAPPTLTLTPPAGAVPTNINNSYLPTPVPTSTSQAPAPSRLTDNLPTANADAQTPAPATPSFISFFIQHIRTDPQARLCRAHIFFQSPMILSTDVAQLARGDIVHLLNIYRPDHPFSDAFNDIRCRFVFVDMVATDCEICAERKN